MPNNISLPFLEDETNQDDDVLRNRIRHHIIPQLKRENPRFLDHVLGYTQQLSSTLKVNQQFLQQQLTRLLENDQVKLSAWLNLDQAMRRAVIKRISDSAWRSASPAAVYRGQQFFRKSPKTARNLSAGCEASGG